MEKKDFFEKMKILAQGMNHRFPEGNEPYQIMTRVMEECGEVASEVNHFENSGSKTLKHGDPSKMALASEIKDAMNALMQVMIYYDVENEFVQAVEQSISRLTEEGHIKESMEL